MEKLVIAYKNGVFVDARRLQMGLKDYIAQLRARGCTIKVVEVDRAELLKGL